jgi:hypothetical protein
MGGASNETLNEKTPLVLPIDIGPDEPDALYRGPDWGVSKAGQKTSSCPRAIRSRPWALSPMILVKSA